MKDMISAGAHPAHEPPTQSRFALGRDGRHGRVLGGVDGAGFQLAEA
jgi:hypothetical protein